MGRLEVFRAGGGEEDAGVNVWVVRAALRVGHSRFPALWVEEPQSAQKFREPETFRG